MNKTFSYLLILALSGILFSGCAPKKVIALTFDDGPTYTTPAVLDVLEEAGVPASFFLIGNNINDSTASIMKRAVSLGCEICNHSKTHPFMSSLTAEQIKEEVDYTSGKIYDVLGFYPKFFRPPYIDVNDLMYEVIDLPFICGLGAEDWDSSVSAESRISKVLSQARDGEIILLHDFGGNDKTVEAIKVIIPELKKQGYTFVTVSDLFKIKKVVPVVHEKKIYSFVPQETAR